MSRSRSSHSSHTAWSTLFAVLIALAAAGAADYFLPIPATATGVIFVALLVLFALSGTLRRGH